MIRTFRRAVVTGGAGFVGALVCRRLLEADTWVVCLDNLLTGTSGALQRLRSWPAAIARIFNTYGPGMRPDDGRMVPVFACQALRGEPLTVTGDGSQTRSLCHVSDTVRGLLQLAASDLRVPVNIGNPDEATVRRIATRIIYLPGRSTTRIAMAAIPEETA